MGRASVARQANTGTGPTAGAAHEMRIDRSLAIVCGFGCFEGAIAGTATVAASGGNVIQFRPVRA